MTVKFQSFIILLVITISQAIVGGYDPRFTISPYQTFSLLNQGRTPWYKIENGLKQHAKKYNDTNLLENIIAAEIYQNPHEKCAFIYSGYFYEPFNEFTINMKCEPTYNEILEPLTPFGASLWEFCNIPQKIPLYRGMTNVDRNYWKDLAQTGKKEILLTFTSTSLLPNVALEFCKDENCLFMTIIGEPLGCELTTSQIPQEEEVLLRPCQSFTCKDYDDIWMAYNYNL